MEVFALVGPSGTGKSHRAAVVANNIGASVIIDDGLLIYENRIVAGSSAKSQPTKIGAVKAALFMSDLKAREITLELEKIAPEKLLLLGTSNRMVMRIANRLGLPPIARIINIDEIASEKEIRKARFHRNKLSKHVIPAPAMEVERRLPGILADPFRVFLRNKNQSGKKDWAEKSVIRPTRTYNGKLKITDNAIDAIVNLAAKQIEGITGIGRIKILTDEDGAVQITITPIISYGNQLHIIARNTQKHVKEVVEYMTGLQVRSINIKIKTLSYTQEPGDENQT